MTHIGTYAELLATSPSFARLLEDINQHKQEKIQEREQEQASMSMMKQISKVGSISSEMNDEVEDLSSLPTNIETKQEGTVKWFVYMSYLRAGVGVIVGAVMIVIMYSAQQATSLMGNWWLARWSNDESDRHRKFDNCSQLNAGGMNRVRSMSDAEWNVYRNERFYTYCGKLHR